MSVSRRQLLGLASGATVGALAGCSAGSDPVFDDRPSERAICVSGASLERRSGLGAADFVYDVNGRASAFSFESGFYHQLEQWLDRYGTHSGLPAPSEVWNYGSWTNGGSACNSWHNAGRAFDLSRLRSANMVQASCRFDIWKSYGGAQLEFHRRRYWAVAASLHHDFAYVLTYLYNAQHHNHIHVDNGRSGSGLSTFSPRSRVQVQAVQAICSYVWGEQVELSDSWDRATRRASRAVLERLGVDGQLDDGTAKWRAFLVASIAEGAKP